MKKDIEIPEYKELHLAIIKEYNEAFKSDDYYAYLINQGDRQLDTVLVVSQAEKNDQKSSVMRHKIEGLPPGTAAKVELIQEEVLQLNNHFQVSFFIDSTLYDKRFSIKAGAFKEGALRQIKALNKRGLLIK